MILSRRDKIAQFKDRSFVALRYAMKCPCGHVVESQHLSSSRAVNDVEQQMKKHISECKAYKHFTDTSNYMLTVEQYQKWLEK